MSAVVINIDTALTNVPTIEVGKQGENGATQVVFDVSEMIETYGSGTAYVVVQRRGDAEPYLLDNTSQSGDKVTWTVSNVDTDVYGTGRVQLFWLINEQVAKTVTYQFYVEEALHDPQDAPVVPGGWISDEIGNLDNLTTTAKANLVAAINEVNSKATTNTTAIGTLANLTTTEKSNLVGAINEVNEDVSDVKEDLDYIAPTLTWTSGEYIDANGIIQSGSGRSISNFVPCLEGDAIKYVAESDHGNICGISFWDANYSFISGEKNVGTIDTEQTVIVPSGAYFARLSIKTNTPDQTLTAYLHIERDTNAIHVIDGLNNIAIEKINLPAEFTWNNPPIDGKLFKTGEKYFTTLDVSSKKPTGVRYYVDPVNGNDENSGKLANYPLKTIQVAYTKSDVGEICLYPAYYYLNNRFTNTQKSIAFTTIANTRATFVCGNKMTWTQLEGYTKIWQAPLTNANTIVSDVVKGDVKYSIVDNWASLEATEHTYRCTTYTVFVHSDGVPSEDVMVLQRQLNGSFRFSADGVAYVENIDFIGGVGGACEIRNTDQSAGADVRFYAKNCSFAFGTTADGYSAGNGLRATGLTECIIQDCEAKHNTDDGFNYHIDYSGQECNAVEINCAAHDNGISGGTDNGSTIHDGAKIIRVNTTAYNNNGPNVADVNDGTQSVNYGCKCHDSGTGVDFQVQDGTAEMWLFDCEAHNSQYSVSIGATGHASIMHCRNNRFRGGIQRGATALIYTD